MSRRILIINPNSNAAMTEAMNRRLDLLRSPGGLDLVCCTLDEGPMAVETMEDCRRVVAPLCDFAGRETTADALVVACFSDPGLPELRRLTGKPVFGLCEAGIAAAIAHGGRYGILTNVEDDIADELAYLRSIGLDARLGGIEAAGISVSRLLDGRGDPGAMTDAVERLAKRGASSVVLGCAGFSVFAGMLQRASGLPVVDPVIAATAMAIVATAG
jgi:Asp/Glu/hydantoin racemase